ncbi:hypothetical protein K458DRAFT_397182 [Lentithecium fluviatile CBS 122367]|uniref:Azaphilone pigments biosynthesis cluster protein L N-terminal domain-containing protein n=1 Tax=Lentithecium fluviatile CBS 122367 TaxID=1168545 RepID=A0A6G1IDW3_9PLEO|nr:hypothetical protein K458DRAFT_397182 [Lentithecium fluviatile CBS 122367]
MAEPLSVLASVAGIATAGVAISKMIYEIAHTVKHAPREVSEMAGELSLLSSVLRYLRSALAECIDVCKSRLIKDIRRTVSKIHNLHEEIKELTKNSASSFYRVGLLFKSPRTKNLLAQIEGFKGSVSVMLTTVQLAAAKKQLKLSKEMALKSDVGEIRQLLENLLYANQDSINRMRRRQSLDLSPPPPPPPPPPYVKRARGPQSTNTAIPQAVPRHVKVGSVSPNQLDRGLDGNRSTPLPGPLPTASNPKPHDLPSSGFKTESNDHSFTSSRSNPQQPSFVDWDSEKGGEADHDHLGDHDGALTENSTSTALVPASHYTYEHPTPPEQRLPKSEEDPTKKETRFQLPSRRREEDAHSDSEHKPDSDNDSKEAEASDEYIEWDDSDVGTEGFSRSPRARTRIGTIGHDPLYVETRHHDHQGRVDGARHSGPERHYDPTWYRTDVTLGGVRGQPLEDAATWLYRLVFLGEDMEGRTTRRRHSAIRQPAVEVPRAADRLLLQWTNAEPAVDDASASDARATMADPDPSWSRQLRSSISMLKAKERGNDADRPRDIYVDLSDDSSDIRTNYSTRTDRLTCRHGLIRRRCVQCRDEEDPWNRDETFESHRSHRPPRPGPTPHDHIPSSNYQPNVPYTMYESAERERAYQTHRNETLLKDIERLETNFRRMEALNVKDIAHRERMEDEIHKQYANNIKSLQERIETLKKGDEEAQATLAKHIEVLKKGDEAAREALEKRMRASEEKMAYMKKMEEVAKMEKANPTRACLQISAIADRDHTWNPSFPSLGLSFSRIDAAPAPAQIAIHGTVCWARPFLPSLSELYQVLQLHEWKPLWMRGSSGGQTWFLGQTPILVNFLQQDYMPQIGKPHDQTGMPVHMRDAEDEYAAVGMGLVDRDAIDDLGLPYKERVDGQYRFGVEMTYEDIESLLATSLLMRERRHRKACLGISESSAESPPRNATTSPTGSTPTLQVPRSSRRPATPQPSSSGGSESRPSSSRRHHRKSENSRRGL